MIRFAATLAACAATLPAAAADQALVIGIDSYPGFEDLASLTGAEADARRVADYLTGPAGFGPANVTLLTGDAAGSDAILEALLDKLVAGTAPGERAVFYFAGLGSRQIDPATGLMGDVLLAHDAPSAVGNIPADALAEILDALEGREITVVIDAGFTPPPEATALIAAPRSVALFADTPSDTPGAPMGSGNAPRAVWNAAAPGQLAWEAGGTGVFTGALLDGLESGAADGNANGTVTNAELLTYLRGRSADWCAAAPECAASGQALSPVFEGDLQAAPFASAPAQTPEARPLPVSTLPTKKLDVTDTLGFVTDLFTPSNAANLSISLSKSGPLRLGDTVSFHVTADRPGTLVLLDVNPEGELAQIFPSSLAPSGTTELSAGETLQIPNGRSANGAPLQIRVTEPLGKGFLLGLFIEDDLPGLTAILPQNLAGGPIPNAGQYLYQIAQDLLRLQAGDGGMTATDWSATYLPYDITR